MAGAAVWWLKTRTNMKPSRSEKKASAAKHSEKEVAGWPAGGVYRVPDSMWGTSLGMWEPLEAEAEK